MPTTHELREQRASVWSQMKALNEEVTNRDFTPEEQQTWDRCNTDLDKLDNRIKDQEKYEEREKSYNAVDRSQLVPQKDPAKVEDAAERYSRIFAKFIRQGNGRLSGDELDAIEGGITDLNNPGIRNALGVGTTTAGGYTVPAEFRDVLIRTTKYFSGMLDNATVIHTDGGQTLPWPTVNDTGNVGAILAENTQISQQDVVFGQAALNAYMYTSLLVLVSYQLLNDSAIDVEATLNSLLGERIGRIWNTHFTTGTGSSQPNGIVTGGTVGKTGLTGQTTSIISDDLYDLIHSIDPTYRNERCKFMLGDTSLRNIRKLKDTQGHPLWEPSLQAGTADSLLGYGIVINNDMPVMAANAKSVLFGDIMSSYVVRIVNDVQMVRLGERYADFLQVGFFGFARADGQVQNTAAYRLYQNSAT